MDNDDPVARATAVTARLTDEPARKRSRWGADAASSNLAVAPDRKGEQIGPAGGVGGGGSSAAQAALAMAMAGGGGTTSGAMIPSSSPRMSASAAVAAAMMVGMTPKKEKRKIYIPTGPEFGDIDFRKLLIGPRGATQKSMEEKFGAKILIRGRGSQKDSAADELEVPNNVLKRRSQPLLYTSSPSVLTSLPA